MTGTFRIAGVRCLPLPRVDDVAALDAALAARKPAAADVVALLAKTQGDGGPADTSRARFVAAARACLARRLGTTADEVDRRIAFVVSGGIEAAAAPHMVLLSRAAGRGAVPRGQALAIGRHVSAPLAAADIAQAAQIAATARAVRAALADGGLEPDGVHHVLIKGPAGEGAAGIVAARAATALGAAVALGELAPAAALRAWRRCDLDTWSARVAVSSAAEFPCNEVVALGHARRWGGTLRIAHRAMADLVDLAAVHAALRELGLDPRPQLQRGPRARLVASIAKGGPPPDGMLRGVPLGLDDPSQPAFRRVRGALAGTLVAATGDPFAFVSGGAEHQGPPGGGLVAFVARKR